MNTEQQLCDITKTFWKFYLLEPTQQHFEELFSHCSKELVMIGTGKHEFFVTFEQSVKNLIENQIEAKMISFDILDEWYECLMVTQDVYLVYGGLWAREHAKENTDILINMDTRFSILYRRESEGFKIIHLHHSMPYYEQQEGEYYPKTLSQKAEEALSSFNCFKKNPSWI